ncbi:MAG: transporter [Phycisphaerales bacterium]|nr:transporter [Phycisphaerales bacterium]
MLFFNYLLLVLNLSIAQDDSLVSKKVVSKLNTTQHSIKHNKKKQYLSVVGPTMMMSSPNCYVFSNDVIQTDRPTISQTTSTTPHHWVQTENGFLYQRNADGSSFFNYPWTVWKYGVLPNTEISLQTTLRSSIGQPNNVPVTGLIPFTVGFKTRLFQGTKIIPAVSFYGGLSLPKVATYNYAQTYYAPYAQFIFSNTINSWTNLIYNIGVNLDGFEPVPIFTYTLAPMFELTKQIACFVEAYGQFPQNSAATNGFDAGILYLVTPNFLLDASAGINIYKIYTPYFVSLGISYRKQVVKKKLIHR